MKVTVRKGLVRGERCWVVDWTNGLGKRQRRFFDTKVAAEAEADTLDLQRRQTGDTWLSLSADDRNEVLSVVLEAQRRGVPLRKVWDDWKNGNGASTLVPTSLGKAVEECVTAKRTAGRRLRYVETLGSFLRAFVIQRDGPFIREALTFGGRRTSLPPA